MLRGALTLALVTAAAAPAFPAPAGDKPKIKPTVEFARSWDEAVAEARMLNLPIVVHSHGFYWGPCWGMHSAVLQNKKYIKFAEKSSVEVISLGSLQQGVDAEDRKAARFTDRRDGEEVELMVEYPSLTLEEMLALNMSPANQYNKTGKIPYTSIVDPHTLEEIQGWLGGQGSGTLMEGVDEAQKKLDQEHGKAAFTRRDLASLKEAELDARKETADGEFAKALEALDAVAGDKLQEWPEMLQTRVAKARQEVVAGASKALDDIETLAGEDPRKAKSELSRLSRRLKGTGLEERADAIEEALKAGL